MRPAITFDFHNTLIRCDPWFDLEVAGLPGEVSHALRESGAGIERKDEGVCAYRDGSGVMRWSVWKHRYRRAA